MAHADRRAATAGLFAAQHRDQDSAMIPDETRHAKKANKTPGVLRRWRGTEGTTDNGSVAVHPA